MYNVKVTETFQKETKKLAKKYRQIKKDFLPLLKKLEDGQLVGDGSMALKIKFINCVSLLLIRKKEKAAASG